MKAARMEHSAKKKWFVIAALFFAIIACYSTLGVVQALSLYQGERVLVNLRLWGSALLACLFVSGICTYCALRRNSPFEDLSDVP
jgi:hypothetical protein